MQPTERKIAKRSRDSDSDKAAALKLTEAQDSEIDLRWSGDGDGDAQGQPPGLGARDGTLGLPLDPDAVGARGKIPIPSVDEYDEMRKLVVSREEALSFDARHRSRATEKERRVDAIIHEARRRDAAEVFACEPPRKGYRGQLHPRFPGDHFLSNVDLINKTDLFKIASKMPKGAHLHIHFNACLPPDVLLDIAKGMERMFITSNLPLIRKDKCEDEFENFDRCEIQFSIMSPDKEDPGNLFLADYRPRQTMKFADFLPQFSNHYKKAGVDKWLLDKLIFEEQEAHHPLQTSSGAWEKFNGRTRMMKGLFNYETAYRAYTRQCLEDFDRDNIQYAEIRPNFMMSNQLYHDDGTGPIDNQGIMAIIVEEVERFQRAKADQGKFFGGLKVIYCTPRSMPPPQVKASLDECLQFKKKWPGWIAGFDLVGEEAKGSPIRAFIKELLQFKQDCAKEKLDIPFLFHCGETLDMGTETDGNLVDALLLGSKRIGHGFALAKHPYIMQHMKAKGICLELCPISNEILGLTPRVNGHTMYQLLANNVHCTVSSDNGTLFRSSLSHDFYQVMVGKADMGLYGWKQLVMWSLEHACLSDEEGEKMLGEWEKLWDEFLDWVISWDEKKKEKKSGVVEDKAKM
ncbi:hypothetical protein V8C37DRAFT_405679 [Trichoderma ceciliae]